MSGENGQPASGFVMSSGFVRSSCLLLLLLLLLLLWLRIRRPKNYPPGPIRWPFVGSILSFPRHRPFYVTLQQWAKHYGPVFSVKAGTREVVFVHDFPSAKDSCNMDALVDRGDDLLVNYFTFDQNIGFVSASGDVWSENRRLCLRFLKELGYGSSSMEDVVDHELDQFLAIVREKADVPVSLSQYVGVAFNNAINHYLLGEGLDHRSEKNGRLIATTDRAFRDFNVGLLFLWPRLQRALPKAWTGIARMERIRAFAYRRLEIFMDYCKRKWSEGERNGLVYMYLEEQALRARGGDGSEITDMHIKGTLLDLFAASLELSNTQFKWILLYLVAFPEAQKRIQLELDSVLGARRPEFKDMARLPYTAAFMAEATRHPSMITVSLQKRASEPCRLAGFSLPKETTVVINFYALNHSREYWGDPENFRPERFLDSNGEFHKPDCLIPFSTGKRRCIGEKLATMELFLLLANLLREFDICPVPGTEYSVEPETDSLVGRIPRKYSVIYRPRAEE